MMNHKIKTEFFTMNKIIVLLLLGGFALLLLEIRYDHRFVLHETPIAWTPIAYSAAMLVLGSLALAKWERGGRQVLFWAFGAALLVGAAGFWFHNAGRPLAGVERVLSVWAGRRSTATDAPPALAPLAFCGLGALGMVACARRFQPSVMATKSLLEKS